MSQITINKTFVLKSFSRVSKDTDHIIQQSIKYRKKNSVSPPKNTNDKKKEKKWRAIENVKKKQKKQRKCKKKNNNTGNCKAFYVMCNHRKNEALPGLVYSNMSLSPLWKKQFLGESHSQWNFLGMVFISIRVERRIKTRVFINHTETMPRSY